MKMLTVFFMILVQLDPRYMAQNIFVLRLEAFKDLSWLIFLFLISHVDTAEFFVTPWSQNYFLS